MTIGPFASRLHAPLVSDSAVNACLSDAAAMAAMVKVEAALATAQGQVGVIPASASAKIVSALTGFTADYSAIGESTLVSGLPTVEFVAQLRRHVGGEAASYVHWGATSQDIIDTGFILQTQAVLDICLGRLQSLSGKLAALAQAHRHTAMAGRTRSQQALPISFGLKVAHWLAPLHRHQQRLSELKKRFLCVQFGGAAGNLSALGADGIAVADALADELGLSRTPASAHTGRDWVGELASWLSLVTGSLGKIGQDVALMSFSEIGELSDSAAGGSSTLPQKANPIAAETLIALATYTATQLAGVHQCAVQEHERGGAGWTVEWMLLPSMLAATGGALRVADELFDRLIVRPERMQANLDASNGLLLAETASFALSAHMPRTRAQALVKQACRTTIATGQHLFDVLKGLTDAPCDWDALQKPATLLAADGLLIDRILAEA